MWTRETISDIKQLKAEQANAQSGKLSLSQLRNIAKRAQKFNLLGEKVKKKNEKKKKRGEGGENWKRGEGKEG